MRDDAHLIIAHVITRLVRGGADENTIISCNGQAENGHSVVLISGPEVSNDMRKRLHPQVAHIVVPHLVRPLNISFDLAAVNELCRVLKELNPQIVHTHTSKAGIIGRVAARICRVPFIVHGVHILPFLNVGHFQRIIFIAAERICATFTDAFVNVSDAMMREGIAHKVGRADQHIVVESGMDIARFRRARAFSPSELASTLGISVGRAKSIVPVVIASALEPRKRVVEFVEQLVPVLKQYPNAALLVLGEGVEEARLRETVTRLGLRDQVFVLGYRNELERWIATADICTLASEREGLPRVVIQYALAGKPMVVTRLPGIESVVMEGVSGFVVDTSDLGGLARKVGFLLSNPDDRSRLASGAASLDLSRWGDAEMVNRIEQLYSRLLGSVDKVDSQITR